MKAKRVSREELQIPVNLYTNSDINWTSFSGRTVQLSV